jgi:branched-chain amino acid transport system substrate-binding protein
VAAAVEKAGLDRARVRAALENTQGFVGQSGIFRFSPQDHNGLGMDSFVMLTVKDGRFVPLAK